MEKTFLFFFKPHSNSDHNKEDGDTNFDKKKKVSSWNLIWIKLRMLECSSLSSSFQFVFTVVGENPCVPQVRFDSVFFLRTDKSELWKYYNTTSQKLTVQ